MNVTQQIWGAALVGLGWIAFNLRDTDGNSALMGVAKSFLVVTGLVVALTLYHILLWDVGGAPVYINILINAAAFVLIFLKTR